ncbi:hypothetical protein pETSU_019 [Edwardsiella phage pEt-SU]|uniref:Uncharacterized protein n=1 Tax=Edwardsiella phage pEt-SU TaxID=2562142 RepID=A0A4D6DW67_9CAUD|nr:hypothetical protein HOV39_gp019 [Edwardsiella phage pEt-SU]QBZ70600.1 hypothetical protein pETSU_019 [Edwardsiella phage pEt-SU]
MSDKEEYIYIMKAGEETKVELPPFSGFPSFTITNVLMNKLPVGTEYFPGAKSIPSTRHPTTIRLLNMSWNNIKVMAEYDHSSKMLKVISANVDSVTIKVKA